MYYFRDPVQVFEVAELEGIFPLEINISRKDKSKLNDKDTKTVVRRCSIKLGFLKNFAKLTEKQLCWSTFLVK